MPAIVSLLRDQLACQFAKLRTGDEDACRDACSTVRRLLQSATEEDFSFFRSEEVKPTLEAGLRHPYPIVRHLVLEQLKRSVQTSVGIEHLRRSGLLRQVVDLLSTEDLSVIEKAIALLNEYVVHDSNGGAALLGDAADAAVAVAGSADAVGNPAARLGELLVSDDVAVRLRALQTVVDAAVASPAAFSRCLATHRLEPLAQGVCAAVTDQAMAADPLLLLNMVQFVEKLSKVEAGRKFLQDSGVLASLQSLLASSSDDSLLVNRVMRFLGELSQCTDVALDRRQLLHSVAARLQASRPAQEEALTAIGNIATRAVGLKELLTLPELLREYAALGAMSALPDLRVCWLHSLANVFHFRSVEFEEQQQELFSCLTWGNDEPGTNCFEYLLRLLRRPFPDERFAAFALCNSLVRHVWAVKEMFQAADFYGFLMDRSSETDYSGSQWKYAIIETLVQHAEAACRRVQIGHELQWKQLEVYVREGPLFARAHADVATLS